MINKRTKHTKKTFISTLALASGLLLFAPHVNAEELPKDQLKDKIETLEKEKSELVTKKAKLTTKQKAIMLELERTRQTSTKMELKQLEEQQKQIKPIDIEKAKTQATEIIQIAKEQKEQDFKVALLKNTIDVDIEKSEKVLETKENTDKEIAKIEEGIKQKEQQISDNKKKVDEIEQQEKLQSIILKDPQDTNQLETTIFTNTNDQATEIVQSIKPTGDLTSNVPVSIVPNAYSWGQCTWGAKEMAPWASTSWGNAGQWANSAASEGYKVGSVPSVGSIIVWDDGGWGHVAVVVAVESENNIQVMEANFNGTAEAPNPAGIQNYRGWFNPHGWGQVSYIYPPKDYKGN